MFRIRFAAAVALLVMFAGACTSAPTAPSAVAKPRFDGTGFGLGSGNKSDSTATTTATAGTVAGIGFGLGSGN